MKSCSLDDWSVFSQKEASKDYDAALKRIKIKKLLALALEIASCNENYAVNKIAS